MGAGMKVEVQVESGVYQQEIKPEIIDEEYQEADVMVQGDVYEQVQAHLYAQEGEVYQEVYEGEIGEEDLYHEEVVEHPEVALYEMDKPEVLYEEVYEDV